MKEKIRKQKIKDLRKQQLSFREIGKIIGLSRQRIHQIYTGYKTRPFIPFSKLIFHKRKSLKIKNIKINLQGRDKNREIIRILDKHTCQICRKKWKVGERRFDVHHIDCDKEKTQKYDNLKKEKDNLITLCHKCHSKTNNNRDYWKDYFMKKYYF